MPVAAIITIIGAGLTIVVLAAYLIRVALVLGHINAKLRAVNAGLHTVPGKTEPIQSIVGEINKDLVGVDDRLRGVLGQK